MAVAEYIAAVLQDSPTAFWTLQDASGNPQDSSGNGFHMTTTNGTPDYRQPGPYGAYAINLGFAEFFNRADFATATTNWAWEFWWYPISVGAVGRTIMRTDQNGTTTGYGVGTNSAAADQQFQGVLGNSTRALAANTPPLNTWSHIVVGRMETSVATSVWFYMYNGAIDTFPVADSAPGVPAGITQINAGNFLAAQYALAALYQRTLSFSRFLAHYQALAGTAADAPPIGFSGRGAGW